jgi:hypothetical protein
MTGTSTETPTPGQTFAEGTIPVGEFIVKTPGTCSGQARVAGTRIKVKHIYTWVEKIYRGKRGWGATSAGLSGR